MPAWTCPSGYTCHLEYCLTQSPPDGNDLLRGCAWQHPQPTGFTLQNGGTVYASYRVIYGDSATPSTAVSASIAWNTTAPNVSVNSPVGLVLNSQAANGATTQLQWLNASSGQWVTYAASEPSTGESLTAVMYTCSSQQQYQNDLCAQLTPSAVPVPTTEPQQWDWPASSLIQEWGLIQILATDQADNQTLTYPANLPNFAQFLAGSLPGGTLTCEPLSANYGSGYTACAELADQGNLDIPNDSPSIARPSCEFPNNPADDVLFSGYADPSMRRDPLVTAANPYGTNLWMLYSTPFYQPQTVDPCPAPWTGVVEVHLAYSNTSAGPNGGANWTAWCNQATCTSSSSATPIWPAETFSNGCGIVGATTCYSSHEVSNFWPAPNYPTQGAETWYAAHLMYFLQPGANAATNISPYGCLVISASSSPTALGWLSVPAGGLGGPSTCGKPTNPVTFPSNNYVLFFDALTQLANANAPPQHACASWGEPAVMFDTAPDNSGKAALYLAADCFDQGFVSQGYYIFYTVRQKKSWVDSGSGSLPSE